MHTYKATIRLNGKLENEVLKEHLSAPEVLLLRKIHGSDAVVKVEADGYWEEHFGVQTIRHENGEKETVENEYDDDVEKSRLARVYGEAIMEDNDHGIPRNAIDRMFGEFAPLPAELPEFKKARKAAAAENVAAATAPKNKAKDNLGKVA
jgi:hypothetical protein